MLAAASGIEFFERVAVKKVFFFGLRVRHFFGGQMIDWVVSSLCAVGGLLLAYVVFEYAYRLVRFGTGSHAIC